MKNLFEFSDSKYLTVTHFVLLISLRSPVVEFTTLQIDDAPSKNVSYIDNNSYK